MKTTNLRKFIFICLFLILASVSPNIGLALEISPESISLGDIPKGTAIKKNITIKNNENKTIILEKARSSCTCAAIEYKQNKSIGSGKDYIISLIIDTADLPEGKIKKFIFLSFKNTRNPIFSINIKGNIIHP